LDDAFKFNLYFEMYASTAMDGESPEIAEAYFFRPI
jgi:hypothetical protein